MKSDKSGRKAADGLSEVERAALRDTVRERRSAKVDGATALDACLLTLPPADRTIGEALKRLIAAAAPQLQPRTWYGMPAWALDGKVVLFLQPSSKFSTRYSTIGFSDQAALDNGSIWATAFAVIDWDNAVETAVGNLLRSALGGSDGSPEYVGVADQTPR